MQYLTKDQVADILQVHSLTVKRYIDKGELKAIRLSKTKGLRIKSDDLEEFLKSKKV